jgi:hypothetical protein
MSGVAGARPRVVPAPATAEELAAALRPRPGRAALVHLWASWCRPCIGELPSLSASLRGLADRPIDIITVVLDDSARAGELLTRAGAPGRALRATAGDAVTVLQRLEPSWQGEIPTTIVLDPQGHIALVQNGITILNELEAAIDRVAPPAAKRGRQRKEGP